MGAGPKDHPRDLGGVDDPFRPLIASTSRYRVCRWEDAWRRLLLGELISRAKGKIPEATFVVGDAADPPFESGTYDAVVCRHVLWAMPHPVAAFAGWLDLLEPRGVVLLVEGRWGTGVGLSAAEAERIVRTAG